MDRLSNLPEPVLHRVLYFLIDDKEVARTCVLSKSWRSVWSNLPKRSLSERTFKGNKKDFLFHANNTLQSLLDQNHQGVEQFQLTISTVDSQSLAFLQKWMPMLTTMSVKHLHLNILPPNNNNGEEEDGVDLPSEAFAAESLQKLHLYRCNLLHDHNIIIPFKHHLTTLRLSHVSVKEDNKSSSIVDNIISGCPWLTTMWFEECKGLRNIKVNHKNLRHFTFIRHESYTRIADCRIEIDLPTLETSEIRGSVVRFHNREHSKLESLSLKTVRISRDSFDKSSSCSFPSLEDLTLHYYYYSGGLLCIDAPNIVNFEYCGRRIPTISFKATRGKWSSDIILNNIDLGDDVQSWFLELSEFLHSLSQSDISLAIWNPLIPEVALEDIIDIGASNKLIPVAAVDRLALKSGYAPRFPAFLGGLFRICRPRVVAHFWNLSAQSEMVEKQLTAFLCNNLNQQDHFPSAMRIRSFDFGRGRWRATEQKPLTKVESFSSKRLGHISFFLKWRVDIFPFFID